MKLHAVTIPASLRNAAAPADVLNSLARQFRPGGLCLILVRPDGTVAYHDAETGVFFDRYVVPVLSHTELAGPRLRELCGEMNAQTNAQVWDFVPGALLAAAPLVDRRQVTGIFILAARCEQFALTPEVKALCARTGLDEVYLQQEAGAVASHDRDRVALALSFLLAMTADKLRLASMDSELTSLSLQLSNAYEELSLIEQISGGMRVNRSAAEFFRQACLDVMEVVSVRGMGVALSSDLYHQEPVLYGQLSLPPGHVQRLSQQLLTVLRESKNCLLINELGKDPNFRWMADQAHQLIALPLIRSDRVLGCLFGLDKSDGDFDSVDAKLLMSIANESSIYLENAMLFRDVHDLMMGLLHSLTSAVDAKDAYTCGHSERVAMLSCHLATQLKLSDQQVERIYMAGLLHDVGKIGVPESVLQKTGRLTPEEFEQMKKHPQAGARILDDVKQLEDIIPGVLHHHERYDGRGYPSGLAGKDIPLMGRIICLADCLDAMTSNRTYRKALPLEVALNEIRRCSGTQFDPELAEAFLTLTPDQFRALMNEQHGSGKRLLDMQTALRAA